MMRVGPIDASDPRVKAYARKVALETGHPVMDDEVAAWLFELSLLIEAAKATPEGQAYMAQADAAEAELRTWHPVFLAYQQLPLSAPLPELLAASKRLYGDSGQVNRQDVNMVRLIAEYKAIAAHLDSLAPPAPPSGSLAQGSGW